MKDCHNSSGETDSAFVRFHIPAARRILNLMPCRIRTEETITRSTKCAAKRRTRPEYSVSTLSMSHLRDCPLARNYPETAGIEESNASVAFKRGLERSERAQDGIDPERDAGADHRERQLRPSRRRTVHLSA